MNELNEILTKDIIIKLLHNAKEVTALFAVWTNNLESLKGNNEGVAAIPYYLKWIDVTTVAIENISETASQEIYKQLAGDLVTIIVVPLRGMIEAMVLTAKKNNQALPEPSTPMPTEIFGYKTWAIEYIGSILKWMKGMNS